MILPEQRGFYGRAAGMSTDYADRGLRWHIPHEIEAGTIYSWSARQ